jgi:hypothetical protein
MPFWQLKSSWGAPTQRVGRTGVAVAGEIQFRQRGSDHMFSFGVAQLGAGLLLPSAPRSGGDVVPFVPPLGKR